MKRRNHSPRPVQGKRRQRIQARNMITGEVRDLRPGETYMLGDQDYLMAIQGNLVAVRAAVSKRESPSRKRRRERRLALLAARAK